MNLVTAGDNIYAILILPQQLSTARYVLHWQAASGSSRGFRIYRVTSRDWRIAYASFNRFAVFRVLAIFERPWKKKLKS